MYSTLHFRKRFLIQTILHQMPETPGVASIMSDRCNADDIQHLIFKVYNDRHTLDELLRCSTRTHHRRCGDLRNLLDEPLLLPPAHPRFLTKN